MKSIVQYVAAALAACATFVLFSYYTPATPGHEPAAPAGGKIRLEFDNVVRDKNLVLNSVTYKNASNEDFAVTKFNYFISNIKLTRVTYSNIRIPFQ